MCEADAKWLTMVALPDPTCRIEWLGLWAVVTCRGKTVNAYSDLVRNLIANMR
jgi:hypothetical protein